MKCIRNKDTGEIHRVREVDALRLVISGPGVYCKKSLWKAQQRAGGEMNRSVNDDQSQTRSDE